MAYHQANERDASGQMAFDFFSLDAYAQNGVQTHEPQAGTASFGSEPSPTEGPAGPDEASAADAAAPPAPEIEAKEPDPGHGLAEELQNLRGELLTYAAAKRGGRRLPRSAGEDAERAYSRVLDLASVEGEIGKAAQELASEISNKLPEFASRVRQAFEPVSPASTAQASQEAEPAAPSRQVPSEAATDADDTLPAPSRPALSYEPVAEGACQLLWSALAELGFEGGRVLDPSCADGQVVLAAPDDVLDACEVRAVEVDASAADEAALALGSEHVVRGRFADAAFTAGSFDAAVGFLPYSGAAAGADADAALRAQEDTLLRAVDALRPGGVAAFIASRDVMDSRNDRARREVARAAELVAAVRLPDGAAGAAHRGADVIVLRKLEEGRAAPAADWVSTRALGAGLYENELFASRSDLVIGRVAVDETAASGPRLAVRAGKRDVWRVAGESIAAQIDDTGAWIGDEKPTDPLYVAARDGGSWPLRFAEGRVLRTERGRTQDLTPRSEHATARLAALSRLGELAARQLDLEKSGAPDEACDEARSELAGAYEDFTVDWGRVAHHRNRKALAPVPEAPTIKQLEELDENGKYASRAGILSHRIIKPPAPRAVSTPEEALSWSMSTFGQVRMDAMAARLGKPYDEVWQALSGKVFRDVAGDGAWVARSEFLSGNVREKLAASRAAQARLDEAIDTAATRAWREARGVPQIAGIDDSKISDELAAYLAAGRDLESRRKVKGHEWGELAAAAKTSLADVDGWCLLLVRAQQADSDSVWQHAFEGKLALEQKRAACAIREAAGGDLSRDEVLAALASRRVEIVPSEAQDAWVAAGASALAGKSLDSSMSWAVAVEQAVAYAALATMPAEDRQKLSGDTRAAELSGGARTAELFVRDPALAEVAHLVTTGAPGYQLRELAAWYAEADRAAVEQMEDDEFAEKAAKSHHDRMAADMASSPRARAAISRLVALLPAYEQQRGKFIATYRESDAPEAAAYRARRDHLAGNIEALSGALPASVDGADIAMRLGATWIPGEYIARFAYETIGVRDASQPSDIQAAYSPRTTKWTLNAAGVHWAADGMARWGTARVKPLEMIRSSLNGGRIKVNEKHKGISAKDGRTRDVKVVNVAETLAAQAKQVELEDAFEAWCHADAQRESALAKIYNERFCSVVPRRYDGSELEFPEMNADVALRPWQRDAVARILESKSGTLLAHCVGAGKTLEFICGAMESKRRGLCSKPLIVVPNHLVEQTAREFRHAYPAARLLVSDKKSFDKENRAAFVRKAAEGDWDSVIIGQSQFDRLPLSTGALLSYAADHGEEFDEAEKSALMAEGTRSETAREVSKQRATFEHRMDKLLRQSRTAADDAPRATFDALGTDMLVVDEAHAYKNLAVQTKLSRVSGVAATGSARAEGMLMKTRWMRERFGGRSLVFATGTPVSNSMIELYNMQTYLDPETLEGLGIRCFDEWAATFGRREAAMEVTVDGGAMHQKERFSRFSNLPELMSAVHGFADVKTADDIALALPEADIRTVAVEPTDEQRAAVDALIARADRLRAGGVDPAEDNMLKVTGDGRKVALDARLLSDERFDDDIEPGRKLTACADNVAAVWEQTREARGAQLIFCDTSTPHAGKWNIYDEMKKLLVERGIPERQIAFVHDAKDSPERKEELFAKVRAGQIRVLVGSTEKMGTGTNVQERLAAIHDLDCPWRPADLEQRQGRILRQGNIFPTAQIFRYVCIGTFDSYLYQTVERKQRFISQALTSAPGVREAADLDDATTLTYAEMKAAATGDARIRERMDLECKISKLEILQAAQSKRAAELVRRAEAELPEKIERLESALPLSRADAARVKLDEEPGGTWAGMEIAGARYTAKSKAGRALAEAAGSIAPGTAERIGSYRGLDIVAAAPADGGAVRAGLAGAREHMMGRQLYAQASRNVAALDELAHAAACEPGAIEADIASARAEIDAVRAEAARPFAQAAELSAAKARAAELDAELAEEQAGAVGFDQKAAEALAELMGPDEQKPMRRAAVARAQARNGEFVGMSAPRKLEVLERDLAEVVAARVSGKRCPPLACGGRAVLAHSLKEILAGGGNDAFTARCIMHGMTDMLSDAQDGLTPAQHERKQAALEKAEAEHQAKLDEMLGDELLYDWEMDGEYIAEYTDEDIPIPKASKILSDDEAARWAAEQAAPMDVARVVEAPDPGAASSAKAAIENEEAAQPQAADEVSQEPNLMESDDVLAAGCEPSSADSAEEIECAMLIEELGEYVPAQLSGRAAPLLTLGTMRATSARIEELAPRCGFTGQAALAALEALRAQWREASRVAKLAAPDAQGQSTGAR